MKRILIAILLTSFWAAGFSENLPLNEMGKSFSSPNLAVQWKVPTNVFPSKVSIYRLLPTKFPPDVTSNLMDIARLTANDRTKNDSGENFTSSDKMRKLRIDSVSGTIDYTDDSVVHGGTTNVSVGVPDESELFGLTTNILPRLGLKFSDIKGARLDIDPVCHAPPRGDA